jgi:crotonobetainyl-CoA:carnitine CoA-transferase CaiB-like acyl-CoA transferase
MEQHIARPIGTLHPNIAPYGEIIKTKDNKSIMLAIGTDKQFQSLLSILDLDHLSEKYGNNKERVIDRKFLLETLNSKSLEQTAETLNTKLKISNIPFAEVKNIKEVFYSKDAQEMVVENPITNDIQGKYIRSISFKSEFN